MTSFLSVGIDVGTTSTHLTFSRLTVVNVAPANQSPLAKIEKRELIFQSEIHITPLTCDGNIDAAAVYELIAKEYEKAAINRDDIKVGAAIITGETALKRNAREVIEKLCSLSGDLVAVGAGPHMEALLSARGSGAAEASRQCRTTILNVDIGGGTMNLALYQNGAIVSTHCLGIGGRCVQLKRRNEAEFDVVSMTQSAKEYLQSHACESLILKVSDLRQLANSIASDVVSFINQDPEPTVLKKLPLTSIENAWTVPDEIWLSGGVAEFAVDEQMNRFEFCDLGGLLCDALVAKLNSSKMNFKIPTEPIRATVMGAGMYSMQVSGSTIDFDINCLPLRNIPLVRPFRSCDELLAEDVVAERMLSAIIRIDPDMRRQTIAIELPSMESVNDYPSLKKIAAGLAKAAKKIAGLEPFVLIVREDLGMALGQLIRRAQDSSNKTCPLIVLDGITTSDGDFIDVGSPVSLDGNEIARTLPVVLKTLVFERDR
ncbi:MAG: hypothetical protein C0507_13615 [Cyanobacteria bacterium PR.3.49]|nr:hypothetical protein [Cyanobacteria bacterium PR.3.49]